MAIHEEGTGFTWQQNQYVTSRTENFLVDTTHQLHLWSLNLAFTPKKAAALVQQLGKQLYDTFIGAEGDKVLSSSRRQLSFSMWTRRL